MNSLGTFSHCNMQVDSMFLMRLTEGFEDGAQMVFLVARIGTVGDTVFT